MGAVDPHVSSNEPCRHETAEEGGQARPQLAGRPLLLFHRPLLCVLLTAGCFNDSENVVKQAHTTGNNEVDGNVLLQGTVV